MIDAATFYLSFFFVLPSLFTINLNLYFIFPFRSHISKDFEHPVIHIIEGWSLGFLYCKALYSLILVNENNAISRNLRALVQDGWLRPNLKQAMRQFILPLALSMLATILTPLGLAVLLIRISESDKAFSYLSFILNYIDPSNVTTKETVMTIFAFFKNKSIFLNVYPICAFVYVIVFILFSTVYIIRKWGERIRDELYLVGERLNNIIIFLKFHYQ